MINNRRNFLKKSAGVIAGAGVVSSFISKYTTGLADASKKKIRWGMVIDMKKCVDGCVKCIDACHVSITCRTLAILKTKLNGSGKVIMQKFFPAKTSNIWQMRQGINHFCHCATIALTRPA